MPQQRATFILRLWREQDAPAGVWLSEVEYVQATSVDHFAGLPAAFEGICAVLSQLEEAADRQDSDRDKTT